MKERAASSMNSLAVHPWRVKFRHERPSDSVWGWFNSGRKAAEIKEGD